MFPLYKYPLKLVFILLEFAFHIEKYLKKNIFPFKKAFEKTQIQFLLKINLKFLSIYC